MANVTFSFFQNMNLSLFCRPYKHLSEQPVDSSEVYLNQRTMMHFKNGNFVFQTAFVHVTLLWYHTMHITHRTTLVYKGLRALTYRSKFHYRV